MSVAFREPGSPSNGLALPRPFKHQNPDRPADLIGELTLITFEYVVVTMSPAWWKAVSVASQLDTLVCEWKCLSVFSTDVGLHHLTHFSKAQDSQSRFTTHTNGGCAFINTSRINFARPSLRSVR